MNKLAKILSIAALALIGLASATTVPVFAADNICGNDNIDKSIQAASGCSNAGTTDELPKVIVNIISGVIAVAGIIAVIFIIIGGINYMISTGDAGKVKKARDTVLYAAIGLVICILAFAIVNFVVRNLINGEPTTSTSASASDYTSQSTCEKAGYTWNKSTKKCK